jgi:hypothetical protein
MDKMWHIFKKWFIPHEGNDYKPHMLRPRTIFVVCVLAIAAELAFLSGFSMPAYRSPFLGDVLGSALTDGTNAARVANNLPPLQVNPVLTRAAQEKVDDMVANNYFAHTSPQGVTPWYWFENVGYDFTYAGENLAVDFSDSQDVTDAWLNSPEHRTNIMNVNFTQFGIAIATGTFEGHAAVYVAEEFGAPAPLMTAENAVPGVPMAAAATMPKAVKPAVKLIPTIIATSNLSVASSEQTFISVVKGVATETAPSVVQATPAGMPQFKPQTNVVQQAIVNPRSAVDSIYLFMALLFTFALLLNIFIKIRIQHPNIIMGGIVAISLAGIFIILNQHLFLSVMIK